MLPFFDNRWGNFLVSQSLKMLPGQSGIFINVAIISKMKKDSYK
jgi:hypothetical protein